MVIEIIPGLFLGSYDECARMQMPTVHVGGMCHEKQDPDRHLHVPAWDDDSGALVIRNMMPAIIRFITRWREAGQSVFVHCNAGISRSPTVVYFYLRTTQNMTSAEFRRLYPQWAPNLALQRLIEIYPNIYPLEIDHATEIIEGLFIGDMFSCWHLQSDLESWIGIVHLCPCERGARGEGLYVPIEENSPEGRSRLLEVLPRIIHYVREHRAAHLPVLFHCNQAISRSPSMAFLVCHALELLPEADPRAQFKRWYPTWSPSKVMNLAIQDVLKRTTF